jgi:hypothetical protein
MNLKYISYEIFKHIYTCKAITYMSNIQYSIIYKKVTLMQLEFWTPIPTTTSYLRRAFPPITTPSFCCFFFFFFVSFWFILGDMIIWPRTHQTVGDLYTLRNMVGLSDFLGGKRFTDNSGGKKYWFYTSRKPNDKFYHFWISNN